MAEILRFPGGPPEHGKETKPGRVHMQKGVYYDLHPPSNIQGKNFDRVQCEYEGPNSPGEYVVRGVPQGGTETESFVLRFGKDVGVSVTESKDQRE